MEKTRFASVPFQGSEMDPPEHFCSLFSSWITQREVQMSLWPRTPPSSHHDLFLLVTTAPKLAPGLRVGNHSPLCLMVERWVRKKGWGRVPCGRALLTLRCPQGPCWQGWAGPSAPAPPATLPAGSWCWFLWLTLPTENCLSVCCRCHVYHRLRWIHLRFAEPQEYLGRARNFSGGASGPAGD